MSVTLTEPGGRGYTFADDEFSIMQRSLEKNAQLRRELIEAMINLDNDRLAELAKWTNYRDRDGEVSRVNDILERIQNTYDANMAVLKKIAGISDLNVLRGKNATCVARSY